MKIVIAGGTGFLGNVLVKHFKKKGYNLVVLTRQKSKYIEAVQYVQWDGKRLGDWTHSMKGANILINLSGKSVDCRYTDKNKKAILDSRVDSTTILGQALAQMDIPPKLWLNASTATIYESSRTQPMDEDNGIIGEDFSMSVAKAWEKAFFAAKLPTTRKVALRISLVLGGDGGVIPLLSKLTKFGLGGRQGSGEQKFAWIHYEDMIRIVEFVIDHQEITGPINCVSPSDINNKEFTTALRKALGMPFGLPTFEWMIKVGTFFMRSEPELILKSRYVIPKRLLGYGFAFQYGDIDDALTSIIEEV